MRDIVATASIDIPAPPDRVWMVLTDNQLLGEVMFGSTIITDWEVGGPIVFRGEWEGKPFEDKGVIEEFNEPRRLRMSHFSPLSGAEDIPENYHQVVYDLEPLDGGTRHPRDDHPGRQRRPRRRPSTRARTGRRRSSRCGRSPRPNGVSYAAWIRPIRKPMRVNASTL